MPISFPYGYILATPEPIDSRMVIAADSSRFSISSGVVYEGLVVYQMSDKKLYKLIDPSNKGNATGWKEIPDSVSLSLTQTIPGPSSSLILSSSGAVTSSLADGLVWIVTEPANQSGQTYIWSSGSRQWYFIPKLDQTAGDVRYLVKTDTAGNTVEGNITMSGSTKLIGTSSWADKATSAVSADTVAGGEQWYVPLWTDSNGTLAKSTIYQNNDSKVGIGTSTPTGSLDVKGQVTLHADASNNTTLTLYTYQNVPWTISSPSSLANRLAVYAPTSTGGTTKLIELKNYTDATVPTLTFAGGLTGEGYDHYWGINTDIAKGYSSSFAVKQFSSNLYTIGVADSTDKIVAGIKSNGNGYFSGNVGIGTSTPTKKLEISGSMLLSGSSGTDTTYYISNNSSSINLLGIGYASSTPTNNDRAINIGGISTDTAGASVPISLGFGTKIGSGTGNVAIGYTADASGGSIAISTNGLSAVAGANAVAIGPATSGSDSVSIGNSSKSSQASIAIGKAVEATGSAGIAIGAATTANGDNAISIGRGITNLYPRAIAIGGFSKPTATKQFVAGGTDSSNLFVIDNVYFGSGPQGNLMTSMSGYDYTINGSGGYGADRGGGNITIAGGKGVGSGSAGDIIFSTATTGSTGTALQSLTNRVWVKGHTGNVGIGTSTPAYKLDVSGSTRITNGVSITGSANISGSILLNNSNIGAIAITGSTIYTVTPDSITNPNPDGNIYLGESTGLVNDDLRKTRQSVYIGTNAGGGISFQSISIGYDAGSFMLYSTGSIALGYRNLINSETKYTTVIGYQSGAGLQGENNIIIGTNISLPNGTRDSINLGGIIFATGSYMPNTFSDINFIGSAGGKVGINVVSPTSTLHVSGTLNINNTLYVTGSSVGIGISSPTSSAALELNSATQGFLPPRIYDVTTIPNPVDGLIAYDTSTASLRIYIGGSWLNLFAF